ncbi:MAG: hypothetical protein M0024_11955 [Nitrospiraceae bacterium]|nr:hypothetical protein [Nitrospiraceae bacterium]
MQRFTPAAPLLITLKLFVLNILCHNRLWRLISAQSFILDVLGDNGV